MDETNKKMDEQAEPNGEATPSVDWEAKYNELKKHSREWEKLAKTCRYLLSILFILFMIHLSRKMFFNGGDD